MKALCSGGCGRQATKASGWLWCYWCDPAVDESKKLQARKHGGQMTKQAAELVKTVQVVRQPDPELAAWADTIAWADEAAIHAFQLELAKRIAKGTVTTEQGQLLERLASKKLKALQAGRPSPRALEKVVKVMAFGTGGAA